MGRYFISIGGGHYSDIHSITFSIKEKLNKIFDNNYNIRIIDLDEMRGESPVYTEKDVDFNKLYEDLVDIKSKEEVTVDAECAVETETKKSSDIREIILVCGVYALYDVKINSLMNLKIFMDTDLDFRLIKLISTRRDFEDSEVDRINLEKSIDLYMNYLRPEWFNYVKPTRFNADMIVPLKYKEETLEANHDKTSMLFLDGIVSLIQESDNAEVRANENTISLGDFNSNKRRKSSLFSTQRPQLSFPRDFQQECTTVQLDL